MRLDLALVIVIRDDSRYDERIRFGSLSNGEPINEQGRDEGKSDSEFMYGSLLSLNQIFLLTKHPWKT